MQDVALAAALCSAAGVAVSTSLQHQQAGAAPSRASGSAHLLAHLIQRPRWVAAQLVSLASFCLHAIALRYGSLALVQPVVVSGMVLAVPVRAALSQRSPALDELGSVLLTGSGLTAFLLAAGPVLARGNGVPSAGDIALGFTGAGLVVAAATHYAGTRWATRHLQASLLGVAAGVLFGVTAGLLKLVLGELESNGMLAVLTSWPAWALTLAGIAGSAVNQRAYRAGKLSASMPLLNITDILVSLGFGLVALGEVPAHSPSAVVAQCCALCCVVAGLWAHPGPDPSPVVRRRVIPTTRSARSSMTGSWHGQQHAVRRSRRQRNARRR